jgi:uncharacterized protein YqfA (UPF0365 family)
MKIIEIIKYAVVALMCLFIAFSFFPVAIWWIKYLSEKLGV